ncbi:hypothetical protein GS894_03115 [Rhodococcus hoagii]|jgi:transcriptional regulator with XRE-family HTH domain|uniref:HTH cro/C1-type domain-containing protein n=2 Tax=Rhodococcus hoagii TaxID=43767 RepID=E9T0I2_RHOHA|nr:helix-turn-helix transcriptional regulator [Prescottella equi]AVP67349.1 XRE family transcriptional regulator [Prescottella equi]AVP67408.1 XRE family transcriptional regulator [Prescottella equi]EGD23933.1 hypothetical protein HMPREF0724_12141 [Prescottella equi ATCC 33707]MBM4551539.1 hypothetical protein [Prescottella equi]MBM4713611.1 hypothetical protein [Prescottella equi]
MDKLSTRIAEAVQAAIDQAGENLHSVAVKTGIPRTTLGHRLKATRPFDVDQLALIANALNREVSEFLPERDVGSK